MKTPKKIPLKDLNSSLICNLCGGYYIDATTLVDCMHTFCRGCILRHFENKLACPTCNAVYKKKSHSCLRQDLQIQTLVYKTVPGLYAKEMQRRDDFHRSTGVRASSSCSDDSVLGDMMLDHEEWVHTNFGEDNQFLSPDDSISLSLEYYQYHLDKTLATNCTASTKNEVCDDSANVKSENSDILKSEGQSASDTKLCAGDVKKEGSAGDDKTVQVAEKDEIGIKDDTNASAKEEKLKDRRFLQCPAAVSMTHLQKFLRMKYALSAEHKVDVIYEGEVLPSHFSLIDVAYTFKWQRTKPMRFFYRIFTPMKIRPIKIINTSSSGQKQLQIVPVTPTSEQKSSTDNRSSQPIITEADAQNRRDKEILMAELQLQSKAKAAEAEERKVLNSKYGKSRDRIEEHQGVNKSEKRKHSQEESSVYDYDEHDKEEMKRFAEKRDREWQLQKHQDEEPRPSKKRKKSKHSKSDFLHKKRKLHAEITSELSSKEESIKLKVKLTPHNGHKHKHHKSVPSVTDQQVEVSSKEKLLKMRQIRHKNISTEEKISQPSQSVSYEKNKDKLKSSMESSCETKGEFTITIAKTDEKVDESRPKTGETRTKTSETQTKTNETRMKTSETQTKCSETQTSSSQSKMQPVKTSESKTQTASTSDGKSGKSGESRVHKTSAEPVITGKTLRSDFTIKTNASKDICTRQTTVQIERNELMERHAQQTFLRTFPSYTEKHGKSTEKVATNKVENIYKKLNDQVKPQTARSAQLPRLQQQFSVKAREIQQKLEPTKEKKASFNTDKPHILNPQYHSGFTVSKIESGVKRKAEPEENPSDKRPSLEITLISPPTTPTASASIIAPPKQSPTPAKRPPPATIPLDRIKKSITLKSGISIIPKMPEKCDNIGALDLSKPHKTAEAPKAETKPNGLNTSGNGLKQIPSSSPGRILTPDKNVQLSNLQMLSKVASEHPNLNKSLLNLQNKPRPQMPSLQTLKIPNPQNNPSKTPNLAKLPKLNEINKSQFRMVNAQLRNMRPNQNQSIRNIPNPSLLVRQQNQNRLNSLSSVQNSVETKDQGKSASAASSNGEKGESAPVASKTCEAKEAAGTKAN